MHEHTDIDTYIYIRIYKSIVTVNILHEDTSAHLKNRSSLHIQQVILGMHLFSSSFRNYYDLRIPPFFMQQKNIYILVLVEYK